jgi:hypothetical protein
MNALAAHCLLLMLCTCVCPSCLAGQQQQSFVVEFDEPSGSNPLMEMMMKVGGGMGVSAQGYIYYNMHAVLAYI